MKLHFLAATALTVVATPALAQDADPEFFDGLYVSGAVSLDAPTRGGDGLVFDTDLDGEFDNNVLTTAGNNAFPGFCNGRALGATIGEGCTDDDSDIGYAVRIGIDSRLNGGPIVGGLLVEASKSEATEFTNGFSSTPASYTVARQVDYAISGRGRLGISPGDGRGRFYVTGGVSYADLDREFFTTNGANSFTLQGDNKVWGGQVGGGAELMLTNNLSLGLEYLYSSYEDDDASVAVGPGTAGPTNPFLLVAGGTDLRSSSTDFDFHSFRATVGFHF